MAASISRTSTPTGCRRISARVQQVSTPPSPVPARRAFGRGGSWASGLDVRAYRLNWPAAMSIYEVDQPQVIEWKQSVLSGLGWTAEPHHHCVGFDWPHDGPTAMRQEGFDDAQPTVWIIEVLLIGYLPDQAHDEILDAITALSAPGSRIVADYVHSARADALGEKLRELHPIWNERDPEVDLSSLTFSGQHADPAAYLADGGG